MANLKKKVKANVDGDFFVDETCINCDACRKFAPSIFGDDDYTSFVKKQPEGADEELQAQQALLACPVACIGDTKKSDLKNARDSFPKKVVDNIYINGFNINRQRWM